MHKRPMTLLLSLLLMSCNTLNQLNKEINTSHQSSVFTVNDPHHISKTTVLSVTGTVTDLHIEKVIIKNASHETQAVINKNHYSGSIQLHAGENKITITAINHQGNSFEKTVTTYLGSRVAAGGAHSAYLQDGKLYTWGRNNMGQLGFKNTAGNYKTPHLVDTSIKFVALSLNQNQSAAITEKGELYTWGDDHEKQLGRGKINHTICKDKNEERRCHLDVSKVNIENIAQVSVGYAHMLALKENGEVWAWGQNDRGQLGHTIEKESEVPVKVDLNKPIIAIAAAASTSYALDNEGNVWAWGSNEYGNLGIGSEDTKVHMPQKISIEGKIIEIAAGKDHVLALHESGKVYGWGLNFSSQIGFYSEAAQDNKTAWDENILLPKELPFTEKVRHIYANGTSSYLSVEDGSLRVWGQFARGMDTTTGFPDWFEIDEPTDQFNHFVADDLAVGALHQIAINKDGGVYSWGWNFEGSLGGGQETKNASMYHIPIALNIP